MEASVFDGVVLIEADVVNAEGAGVVFGNWGFGPTVKGLVENEVVVACTEGVVAVGLRGLIKG